MQEAFPQREKKERSSAEREEKGDLKMNTNMNELNLNELEMVSGGDKMKSATNGAAVGLMPGASAGAIIGGCIGGPLGALAGGGIGAIAGGLAGGIAGDFFGD